jgi:DNA mismatch repair protein MutL
VRPDIHIETQRDDRKATIWPACSDSRDRIAMILSEDDAAGLIEVEHEDPACRIHAFVSTPERTRPNGQGLYLFVNGRPVRDRLLRHALIEAYRDLLPRGRFPIGVLFAEVAPESVDVNVHPAKWEVRFSDPQAIHRSIRRAVRDAMASRSWLGTIRAPGEGRGRASGQGDPSAHAPHARSDAGARFTSDGAHRPIDRATGSDDWIFAQRRPDDAHGPGLSDTSTVAEAGPAEAHAIGRETLPDSADGARPVASFGSLSILGQLRASYLLAETEDGLMVVDQHAAHERILYEGLRKSWLEAGVLRQGLLTPVPVELSPGALAALAESPELIERLGFEIEPFGDDAVLVRAMPAEIAGQDVRTLVEELAAALAEVERDADSDASAIRWLPSLDRLFATMACHSARRFGDRLPAEEQRAILAGLDKIPWAPTCPHGRPVAILLSHEDLELRFRRR